MANKNIFRVAVVCMFFILTSCYTPKTTDSRGHGSSKWDQVPSKTSDSKSAHTPKKTRYIEDTPRNRTLNLSGLKISETEYGGVERWYAVDKYGDEKVNVRFQVGYFKENQTGFILFEGGSQGELALYHRDGLDLRWDWGRNASGYRYSIVIQPDGTGLYYDFSTSVDGTSKPRDIYKMRKF